MNFSPLSIGWLDSLLWNTKICFLLFSVALQLSSSSPLIAQPADSHAIVAMVSIQPQEWLVEQIGGDRVEVAALVGPADSPATFQPTDAQMTRLMSSDIFFTIGVPFEQGRWLEAVKASGRVPVVDTSEGIVRIPFGVEVSDSPRRQDLDPHIWLSPSLLKIQAATIAGELSIADPGSASFFDSNLRRLESELDDVDRRIESRLSLFHGDAFFVFHPSLGYFAQEYGLRQVAIEIEGKEPSDRELTALQREARELNVRTIFVQEQIHSRSADAVAAAVGARVVLINPLERDVLSNLTAVSDLLVNALQEGPVS